MLKQGGNTIRSVNRFQNLFVLNTKTNKKMMIMLRREQSTDLKN